MNTVIEADGNVDSITLRLDFIDKEYRDEVVTDLTNCVINTKLVATLYDKEHSSPYRQITQLISSNTTIATITKSAYKYENQNILSTIIQQYCINISFFGLHRYNKKIDTKSLLLFKTIVAYLNTNNKLYSITQLDICADVPYQTDNLLAVCINRKARKQYHLLGNYDKNGNTIQTNSGTYEIEKFESPQKRNNVMKLGYLYDKRKKEIDKANNDIGYELSRFEVKFQSRYFLQNEVSVGSFLKELRDYSLFYFEDIKQKEKFAKQYNKANSNKHKNNLIFTLKKSTPMVMIKMWRIGEFLKMLDTIRFDSNNNLIIGSDKYYLYRLSRFNRNKNFKHHL